MLISIKQRISFSFHTLQEQVLRWIKPPTTSLLLGTLADLTRGKSELITENALLRQQLIILRRQIKRPAYRKRDRFLLVFLVRIVRTWKQALFIVQPETVLRRSQTDDSEVYKADSSKTNSWTELGHLPVRSCGRDVGL